MPWSHFSRSFAPDYRPCFPLSFSAFLSFAPPLLLRRRPSHSLPFLRLHSRPRLRLDQVIPCMPFFLLPHRLFDEMCHWQIESDQVPKSEVSDLDGESNARR
ncbi:hypothetical protein ZIOFF_021745 [Zingiber officinale]|uniref:Uncharacterized protein n=1 Tax=Zingiber officinale TaxID=94328 RepID=A0A8J5L8U6_ZINOF|nr:hypothetical protein ZIOFF_021745 [Zingiber officinale]